MYKKTIVIFSHGFGVRSGSYGLFTDLIKEFDSLWIESLLTEYCNYNPNTNEVRVKPFSEQAKILQATIDKTIQNNADSDIILIGQSQWSTIISFCNTEKIKKIIMISPFFHTEAKDIVARYTKDPNNIFSMTETSTRKRSDGTTTMIPPSYRKERFNTDVLNLYNKKAIENEIYIFYGLQDQIINFDEYNKVKNIYLMNLDGDHDFSKQYRQPLIDKVKHIVTL